MFWKQDIYRRVGRRNKGVAIPTYVLTAAALVCLAAYSSNLEFRVLTVSAACFLGALAAFKLMLKRPLTETDRQEIREITSGRFPAAFRTSLLSIVIFTGAAIWRIQDAQRYWDVLPAYEAALVSDPGLSDAVSRRAYFQAQGAPASDQTGMAIALCLFTLMVVAQFLWLVWARAYYQSSAPDGEAVGG